MTSALLVTLLKAVAILGVLLLVGTFFRAKVPLFGKLLLPASVIGGFLGLLLGPNVMGALLPGICIPFSEEYLKIWSLLPGILIVPIFAAAPLGDGMGAKTRAPRSKTGPSIMMTLGIFAGVGALQSVVGYGTNLLFQTFGWDLYRTFGWELSQGFAGGHGTAAAIGGILEGYGLDYWKTSQDIGVTTATVGLFGGMVMGIWMIKRAFARGEISQFKSGGIPANTARGVILNVEEQQSMGREVSVSSCIDPLTIHLALILLGCGAAYWLRSTLSAARNPLLSQGAASIPVWFYALLLMYVVNFVLKKCKLDWMIDRKVKARVTGPMADIAITAAMVSCNVSAVVDLWLPVLVMCLLGFLVTWAAFPLARRMFKNDCAFERSIISWGTNTGVSITGIMLLKICDPDFETPAMADFSKAFALMCLVSTLTSPIYYYLIANGSTWANLGWNLILFAGYATVALVGYRLSGNWRKEENTKKSLAGG